MTTADVILGPDMVGLLFFFHKGTKRLNEQIPFIKTLKSIRNWEFSLRALYSERKFPVPDAFQSFYEGNLFIEASYSSLW